MAELPVDLKREIAELRRQKRWMPSVWALGSTFLILAGSVALLRWQWNGWTALLAFVAIGFMQYRLVLASHEATHRTLLPIVWLNEAVGLLCASLVGVSLFTYRRAHLEHHKFPQSIDQDIDGYIYRPLIKAAPGWPRLMLLFVGNYADILTKLRRKFAGDGGLEGAHALAGSEAPSWGRVILQLLPLIVVQGAVFAILTWLLAWWAYPVFWLAPILTMALQLDRVRTFLEHGYNYFFPGPPLGDLSVAPQSTIDVETWFAERYLFAPFGFAEHQAHHAQLTVPFYNLPALRSLLERHQPGYIRRIRASYLTLLLRMLKAPVAPEFAAKS